MLFDQNQELDFRNRFLSDPKNSVKIISTYPNGFIKEIEYYDSDELTQHSWYFENGQLEFYHLFNKKYDTEYQGRYFENGQQKEGIHYRNGILNGEYFKCHENGRRSRVTTYVDGKEHGFSKQWLPDGNLVCVYQMNHGTGIELWWDHGGISEERAYRDGCLDGFERWWNSNQKTILRESHYRMNQRHGIWWEYDNDGKLLRDSPQFYVEDEKVDVLQYIIVHETNPTLPYLEEEYIYSSIREMAENICQKEYQNVLLSPSKDGFYTKCEMCITCGAPEFAAPNLITWLPGGKGESTACHFYRQPTTQGEINCAIEAMRVSCIGNVYYGGKDPGILTMIKDAGL